MNQALKKKASLADKLLVALFVCVYAWALYDTLMHGFIDYMVYHKGGEILVHGWNQQTDLYTYDNFLPFTYPPFAALLFMAFGAFHPGVGAVFLHLMGGALVWWLAGAIVDYSGRRGFKVFGPWLNRLGSVALLASMLIVLAPFHRSFHLMQINYLIMALVLIDFMRPATRVPRGVLIGIAGGIKLTPLAFGLVLLMRKDIKGVLTLGFTFLATIALGFIVRPFEARQFWFDALSDPSRVGNLNYPDNISIKGVLLHWGIPDGPLLSGLNYGLILVLLVGIAYLLTQLNKRRMVLSEVTLNAVVMLAMSPISWSHHNVWLPLIVMAVLVDGLPVFFAATDRVLKLTTQILLGVAVLGLGWGPLNIAMDITDGSEYTLDHMPEPQSFLTSLPAAAMYAVIFLWIFAAVKNRKTI